MLRLEQVWQTYLNNFFEFRYLICHLGQEEVPETEIKVSIYALIQE